MRNGAKRVSPWSAGLLAATAVLVVFPAAAGDLRRGRGLAMANCARCHAIGQSGASANPKAPPFRTLAERYPLANLEEALAEGIVVGHEGMEMPPFTFSTDQIQALIAYLDSIQRK